MIVKEKTHRHRNLLLTGCYRSGTSLLDKVLHAHPNIVLASQAYPILFHYVKHQFLKDKGLERRYPLDHLFQEKAYAPEEFYEFLESFILSSEHLEALFEQTAAFTAGVWTPELYNDKERFVPGTFWNLLTQFNDGIRRLFPREDALFAGSKEIIVEEYIPYLLFKGAKVVLVIRNPLDVITSVNFSQKNYMGENRPMLYSLRAWRKSVAFALAYDSDPNFVWVTYENLVRQTRSTLNKLSQGLGLEHYPQDTFDKGLLNQYGQPWKGNSSFGGTFGFDTSALGRYKTRLPRQVIAYIEAACYPEMRALGYDFSVLKEFDPQALKKHRDPFAVTHYKFAEEKDYSSNPERIALECERIELLLNKGKKLSSKQKRHWFIHSGAFSRLRDDVR